MESVYLPFGLRLTDSRMVSTDEVPRGRDCGCVCPECQAPLETRKGEVRRHHFAHQPGYENCRTAVETAVHRMAKQIIEEHGSLYLPAIIVTEEAYDRRGRQHSVSETLLSQGAKTLSDIRVESTLENKRPDLLAIIDGQTIAIEIYVTHRCTKEKITWFRDNGIRAIEIDLSRTYLKTTKEELTDILLNDSNSKKWISYPDVVPTKKRLRDAIIFKIKEINKRYANEVKRPIGEHVARLRKMHRKQPGPTDSKPAVPAPRANARWYVCESCRHIWSIEKDSLQGLGKH